MGESGRDLEPEPEPELKRELEEIAQERSLSDIFYTPKTILSSCFTIPDLRPNVTFELKPYYTQMLPKFTGLEDACSLLRQFEDVCSVMHFPNILISVVQTKLIPSALKDSTKCWTYGLAANSVTSWNDL